jgi:predicted nucleic acid-binding Zn ribbon protein
MALVACKECGREVSKSAKKCPHCGAKLKMGFFAKVGLTFLGLFFIGSVFSYIANSGKPETRNAETHATEKRKPTLSDLIADCQVQWEMAAQKSMHDPDSLDWDHRAAKLGTYKHKGKEVPVIAIPYRAKNAFGAKVLNQAICGIDAKEMEVISLIK